MIINILYCIIVEQIFSYGKKKYNVMQSLFLFIFAFQTSLFLLNRTRNFNSNHTLFFTFFLIKKFYTSTKMVETSHAYLFQQVSRIFSPTSLRIAVFEVLQLQSRWETALFHKDAKNLRRSLAVQEVCHQQLLQVRLELWYTKTNV